MISRKKMKGNKYPEPDYCILDLVNSHLKVSKHEFAPFHFYVDVEGLICHSTHNMLHFDCHLRAVITFKFSVLVNSWPLPCHLHLCIFFVVIGHYYNFDY